MENMPEKRIFPLTFNDRRGLMSEKGQTIAVKFKTRYEVSNSKHIVGVIGSISSLGCWNSEHCLCLHQVTGSRGHWEGTVSVPRNQPFEWKLVLVDRGTGEALRWEERSNRRTTFKDGGSPEVVAPWCVSETVTYHDTDCKRMNQTEEITPRKGIYAANSEDHDTKPGRAAITKLTYDYHGDKKNRKAVTFPKPPVTDVITYEKETEKVHLTYPITATNGVERLKNKFEVFGDKNYIAGGGETSKQQGKGQTGDGALALTQDEVPPIRLRRRNSVEYQISRYLEDKDSSSYLNLDNMKGIDDRAHSNHINETKVDNKDDRPNLLFERDPVNTQEKVNRDSQPTPLSKILEKHCFLGTIATVLAVSVVVCFRYFSI